ncbi:phosphotransferase family protein [Rhizobium paknamense]|uniref:Serine/threonine protein kinase n=1 Tax=Rhizobium paknamense TaxID=1206817 RepID=A0ABU0I963_9HYPH|nr:aminoglycoside phosphotransferase family protein [Rhizobium paknamense]MDQ0454752.1 serine/threonine protein kinase [Rhizobium paknamense]
MYLSSGTLVPYLVSRGALSAADLVDDEVSVFDAGRRNRNFKVSRRDGTGLFVKQVPMLVPETTQSLQREAALYSVVEGNPGFAGLAALLPRLRHYDRERHLLAVDLVPASQSLTFFAMQLTEKPEALEALAAELGALLSVAHRQSPEALAELGKLGVFPGKPHWILSFHDSGDAIMPGMSQGARGVMTAVRQMPGLAASITALRAEWVPSCLIHGDLKTENFLVSQPDGPSGAANIQLIDWELADLGDPAWDAGCVLASFVQPLVIGIYSNPAQTTPSPAGPTDVLRAQRCCQAFWKAYAAPFAATSQQLALAGERCVRFAALRLVLTAYEMSQASPEMPSAALVALQAAASIFADPRAAARQLFTLDTGA